MLRTNLVHPPYRRMQPLDRRAGPDAVPDGTILVIGIPRDPVDPDRLQRALARARRRLPNAALTIRIPDGRSGAAVAEVCAHAAAVGGHGVAFDGERPASALRRALTRPPTLDDDLARWLESLVGPTDVETLTSIRCLARIGERLSVAAAAERCGTSARTLRRRLRRSDLPPPRQWLTALRGVRTALALQRRPRRPLLEAAMQLGYPDHSALDQHMKRVAGVGAGYVRERIGWEWFLYRWRQRNPHGNRRRRHSPGCARGGRSRRRR